MPFSYFKQAKKRVVILLTLNKLKKISSHFSGFKRVRKIAIILLTFKTPLRETRCLGNPYFLLYWLPKHLFLDSLHPLFFNTVRPSLVTYPSLCSTCVTYYRMPCHAIGHQLLPTQPCYRKCYRFERAFFTLGCLLSCTPSCCFQSFPGSRQFNLKVSRASCWSLKHNPGLTTCLKHSNPQNIYMVRFYLWARAGQSWSINLHREFNCFLRDLNSLRSRWVCYKPHVLSAWPQSRAGCYKLS